MMPCCSLSLGKSPGQRVLVVAAAVLAVLAAAWQQNNSQASWRVCFLSRRVCARAVQQPTQPSPLSQQYVIAFRTTRCKLLLLLCCALSPLLGVVNSDILLGSEAGSLHMTNQDSRSKREGASSLLLDFKDRSK